MTQFEAPISRWKETILPEWVDYNDHMNVAYYTMIFDHATDVFYPLIGLGQPYRDSTGLSTFAVECHTTYMREGSVGEEVEVTTQFLGYDEKRIHYIHSMRNVEKGYQMAALEQLAVHVNLKQRKVVPITEEPMKLLAAMLESHKSLPVPSQVGSVMRLGSKDSG